MQKKHADKSVLQRTALAFFILSSRQLSQLR